MTKNLTAELARLNELDVNRKKVTGEPWPLLDFIAAAPDAITLANQLHALLVEAEGALKWYASKEAYQWTDKYHKEAGIIESRMAVAFDGGALACKSLTKLHAAGIGGK